MKKHIIIINGCGGVGKDTFVSFCSEILPTTNYSSVKEIKEIATLLGWDGAKAERDRKFLSDLKLLATHYNNFPFRCIVKAIEQFLRNDKILMFIHIRDIEEIKAVVEKYPFIKTLLITNNRIPPITSNEADANVLKYNYDYIIGNDLDLQTLHDKAIEFIISLDKKS